MPHFLHKDAIALARENNLLVANPEAERLRAKFPTPRSQQEEAACRRTSRSQVFTSCIRI